MKKGLFLLIAVLLIAGLTVSAGAAEDRSPADLRKNLENAGFLVQNGVLYEFDTLRLASEGKVLTVFGNNAGSAYVILNLPPAPEQDAAPGDPERNWDGEMPAAYDDPEVENYPENPYFAPAGMHFKLRQDEAVVVITKLPDPCKYWSFIVYDMFSAVMEGKDYSTTQGFFKVGNERSGDYHTIVASVGSPVNLLNAKHDGDSPFGTETVIVICANSTVRDAVLAQLGEAGYPESMVNVMEIPSGVYRVGLEKGRDTFSLFGRISQPEDRDAYEKYMKGLAENATVFRVTPKEETEAAPFPVAPLQARGSGHHETEKLVNAADNLDTIRRNIIDQYKDEYDYEEFFTTIPFYDGITSYLNDMNAQGDVHDAAYLISGDFELKSDEDFVVVYGVNHAYTGKAHYFNAVLHERPMVNGVCTIFDSMLSGTAEQYIGEHQDEAEGYYVYKMARKPMDEHTAIIPYATGNEQGRYYGVDNGSPVFILFRVYLDETGVGADYFELVYDRVIVFHKTGV